MGKDWHPGCFKCTECRIPLDPENFYEKNGLPYCENDFYKLFSPKCHACAKPIKGTVSCNYLLQNSKFLSSFYSSPSPCSRSVQWAMIGIQSASIVMNVTSHYRLIISMKRMVNHIVRTISTSSSHRNAVLAICRSKKR